MSIQVSYSSHLAHCLQELEVPAREASPLHVAVQHNGELDGPQNLFQDLSFARSYLEGLNVSPSVVDFFGSDNKPSKRLQALFEELHLSANLRVVEGGRQAGLSSHLVNIAVTKAPVEVVWQATQLAFFKQHKDLFAAELREINSEHPSAPPEIVESCKALGADQEYELPRDVDTLVISGATAASFASRTQFLIEQLDQNPEAVINKIVVLGGERPLLGGKSESLETFQEIFGGETLVPNLETLPFIRAVSADDHPRLSGGLNKSGFIVKEAEMGAAIVGALLSNSAHSVLTDNVETYQTLQADMLVNQNISIEDTVRTWFAKGGLRDIKEGVEAVHVLGQQPYLARQVTQVCGEFIRADIPFQKLGGVGMGVSALQDFSFDFLMKDIAIKINLYRSLLHLAASKLEQA